MAAEIVGVKVEANGPQNGGKEEPKPIQSLDSIRFQGGPPPNFRGGRGGGRGKFGGDRRPNQRPQPYGQPPKKETQNDAPGGGGGGNDYQQGGRSRHNTFNRDDRRGQEDRFAERIATISGPTIELPPIDAQEKKFGGRCRLYVGNLTNDVTKEEMEALFSPYGETSEFFINAEKNFAFIRLDYRVNAEKAKRELDGTLRKGRQLRVRFAPHSAAVKVKNLNQFVTNELLEWAFQVFGEIERAVVISDERGKSTGEGIVEFARKNGAMQALRRCTEMCYFITASLRPVIVEPYEMVDDVDGYPEKLLHKKNADFFKEREVGPRFGNPGTFEADYGGRWKALSDLYKQKEEALKREQKLEEEKLEAQMEYARYEHETDMLREQLRQREQDKERQKREWELKERQAEERRRSDEELLRRHADEMAQRMSRQEEDRRLRQAESSLFAQAHQLSSMLEQQEKALGTPFDTRIESRSSAAAPSALSSVLIGQEQKGFIDPFEGRLQRQSPGGIRDEPRGSTRWGGHQDRRGPIADDFGGKRRRF